MISPVTIIQSKDENSPEEHKPSPLKRVQTTKVGQLFFKQTTDIENTEFTFTPSEDYNVIYTDWSLDEEVEKVMMEEPDKIQDIINHLDNWFSLHRFVTLDFMYKLFGNYSIMFSDFKQILRDLDVPASEFDRHLICLLLDLRRRKCINILSFEHSLKDYYKHFLEKENLKKSQHELVEDADYIMLNVVNYSYFESIHFRGHFKVFVRHDMHIEELVDMILKRVPVIYRNFEFYESLAQAEMRKHIIPHHLTLQEAGYIGGPFHEPKERFILYTLVLQHPCCPLLAYKPHESQKRDKKRIVNQENKFRP